MMRLYTFTCTERTRRVAVALVRANAARVGATAMAGASVGLLVAHPARTEGVAEKTERELNRFVNKTLPKAAEKITQSAENTAAFITRSLAMVCGTAIIVACIRSRSSLGGVTKVAKRAAKKFKKNKKNKSTTTRT